MNNDRKRLKSNKTKKLKRTEYEEKPLFPLPGKKRKPRNNCSLFFQLFSQTKQLNCKRITRKKEKTENELKKIRKTRKRIIFSFRSLFFYSNFLDKTVEMAVKGYEFTLTSPSLPSIQNWTKLSLSIYKDSSKSELVGIHHQMIPNVMANVVRI